MKRAVYPGSFDPLTLGHLDIIEQAAKLFDEVTVAVTVNLEKNTMFTFDERADMVKNSVAYLPNVKVEKCEGLLADYVNAGGFDAVVRGLRNTSDFVDEQSMGDLHKHLYKHAETVFFMPDGKNIFISSTMARQVISLGGDGEAIVPPYVLKVMKERF